MQTSGNISVFSISVFLYFSVTGAEQAACGLMTTDLWPGEMEMEMPTETAYRQQLFVQRLLCLNTIYTRVCMCVCAQCSYAHMLGRIYARC